MKWSIRRRDDNGLFEPVYVGDRGPMHHEEAKRAADELNAKIAAGEMPASKPRGFGFSDLLKQSANLPAEMKRD